MPECLILYLNGHRFNNGLQKRLAFNYILYCSCTHPSTRKHKGMPCPLNPWASWKRPTLGSGHINKLHPIRSMQKLIVGFFSNPHCFLALLQATQLDTSQVLYVGLNVANCSISAWSDSSPRCPRPFSSSAPLISRHRKIESFGTQAEGRDWKQIEQGILYPCPLVWLIFSEKRLLNHSLDRIAPLPYLASHVRRDGWMLPFFSSSRCSPIHTQAWLHIIEQFLLTHCLSSVFCPPLFLSCSYPSDRARQIENAWRPEDSHLFPWSTGVKLCVCVCLYVFYYRKHSFRVNLWSKVFTPLSYCVNLIFFFLLWIFALCTVFFNSFLYS